MQLVEKNLTCGLRSTPARDSDNIFKAKKSFDYFCDSRKTKSLLNMVSMVSEYK